MANEQPVTLDDGNNNNNMGGFLEQAYSDLFPGGGDGFDVDGLSEPAKLNPQPVVDSGYNMSADRMPTNPANLSDLQGLFPQPRPQGQNGHVAANPSSGLQSSGSQTPIM
jgi:hypothetical protein